MLPEFEGFENLERGFDFFNGIGGERNANRIADAFREKRADANSRTQRAFLRGYQRPSMSQSSSAVSLVSLIQ